MAEFHIQAINICSDIEDLFDSYDIDELIGEDELHVYVEKLGETKREYRRIHSQLKMLAGEEFPIKYPDFDKNLNDLNGKFKIANKKLTKLKYF